MKNNCIFCKIIKGEIPCTKIYEDKKTFAMLDISPASKKGGHTLVMPRKHYELITDLTDEDAKALMLTIKKVSKAILKFGEGMNIIQNNKKIAGQFVPHAHFHLIPRFENDGIKFAARHLNYEGNEKSEYADKIRKFI